MGSTRTKRLSFLVVLLLTACTNSPSSTATSTEALTRLVTSHCTDINAPELGTGTLCIDNGFRVSNDDFSFANWGRSNNADANVTVQTLIDLFGHSSICMAGPDQECILRPTTIQKLEQWNNALAGGRCEGIATLGMRMFLKYDHPEQFSPNAQRVSNLKKTDGVLSQSIVYWWATQFLPEVADRAAQSRTRSPLQLVDDVIQGLANGVGYTLAMYDGSSGHSVMPFAVTNRGDAFIIHVYDNNEPGVRREVIVDSTTNRWRFPAALTAIDGSAIDWEGTTGTLELVPMSARQGPFTCPFCNSAIESSERILTIASRDPQSAGYIYIRTRDGKVISAEPEAITNGIAGATYNIGKGAQNGVATISIPQAAGDFDVYIRRANKVIPAGDVVLNLKRSGSADIQVAGNLAESVIGAQLPKVATLAVRADDTTIHAPTDSNARISLAAGSTLSRTNLSAQNSLVVRTIRDNAIEVSLKGASDQPIDSAQFAASNSVAAESNWSLDGNGRLSAIVSALSPVSVMAQQATSFVARKTLPSTSTSVAIPNSIVISRPG